MSGLLLLLLSGQAALVLGESATDGTGLAGPQVERDVLLSSVELAKVLAGLLVDDGEDTGDRLSDNRAVEANGS